MSIIQYVPREYSPETISILNEYNTEATLLNKSMFTAIGSFWNQYYADIDVINTLYSGFTNLVSQEYLNLLGTVLSTNILDIPVNNPYRLKLLVFSSEDRITNYTPGSSVPVSYDYTMTNLESMTALVNSLFEPDVCLENGTHFEIIGNKLRFYVDIFNDPNIIKDSYSIESGGVNYILFLAVDLVLTEYSIYEKFGTFMYKKTSNTLTYKLFTTALQIFYTGNTNVSITETTLNILLGLPFCSKHNEVVVSIVPSIDGIASSKVYTTKNTYEVHPWATILVHEGQTLSIGTLIGRWTVISDYISNPQWYYHHRFPYELFTRFDKIVYERSIFSDSLLFMYNGRYFFDGTKNYAEVVHNIVDPVEALNYCKKWYRALKGSREEIEQWLYEQYEGYLKYNTFSVKTALTLDNYKYYTDVRTQFLNITKGMPVYLYPVVDTVLTAIFDENIHVGESYSFILKFKPIEEWVEYVVPNFQVFYNGVYNYDGSVNYCDSNTSRKLQLDDASLSITINFAFSDVCQTFHNTEDHFLYDGTYYFDGTQTYQQLNGIDEDFTIIVTAR